MKIHLVKIPSEGNGDVNAECWCRKIMPPKHLTSSLSKTNCNECFEAYKAVRKTESKINRKMFFKCWIDGCCFPKNPNGWMGMGSLIVDQDGKIEFENSCYKKPDPNNTNNVAEYGALYYVLKYFIDSKLTDEQIIVYGDSKLVIMQMSGEWKIKDSGGKYVKGAKICRDMVRKFSNINFIWIPREQNDECDALSRKALGQIGIYDSKAMQYAKR